MGTTVRWGLKEAWSKDTGRWTRTGFEAYGVGRTTVVWEGRTGDRPPYPHFFPIGC